MREQPIRSPRREFIARAVACENPWRAPRRRARPARGREQIDHDTAKRRYFAGRPDGLRVAGSMHLLAAQA
jgi:hypothetical protein